MPNSLSLNNVVNKNTLAHASPWLVLLEIRVKEPLTAAVIETLRFVRNSEDITWNSNTWTAVPFEVDMRYEIGSQPDLSVSIMDVTRTVQSRLQAYKGIVGSEVDLIVINAEDLSAPADIIEYFMITGVSSKDYKVDFKLGAENILSMPFPRRRQLRDRCSWRYKSAECGYVGGLTTCDQSFSGPNGCVVHSNTINYGGFNGINPNAQF